MRGCSRPEFDPFWDIDKTATWVFGIDDVGNSLRRADVQGSDFESDLAEVIVRLEVLECGCDRFEAEAAIDNRLQSAKRHSEFGKAFSRNW